MVVLKKEVIMIRNNSASNVKEKVLGTIVGFILCFPLLNYSIPYFGKMIFGDSSKLFAYLLFFLFWIAIIYALYLIKFKIDRNKLVMVIAFYIFLLFSLVLHPEISPYVWTKFDDPLNPFYSFLMYSVIAFLIADCARDSKLIIRKTMILSCVGIGLCLIYFIISTKNGDGLGYMTLSYNLLFPTVILLLYSFVELKPVYFIFGLTGFLMIFFGGARGALVSLTIPLILFVLFQKNVKKAIKYSFAVLILFVLMFVFLNETMIYNGLSSFLERLGIQSRTLDKIYTSEFLYDSNRGQIYVSVFQNSSILPSGLFYDRLIAAGHSYSHNIVVEFVCDYGYLIGIILLTAISVIILKAFRKSDNDTRLLLFALLSSGIIRLLFSSSYLNGEIYFFFLLGLCLNITKQKHYVRQTDVARAF